MRMVVDGYEIAVPHSEYLSRIGISDINLIFEFIPKNNHEQFRQGNPTGEFYFQEIKKEDIELVEIWPCVGTNNIILLNYRISNPDLPFLFCKTLDIRKYLKRLRSNKISKILD